MMDETVVQCPICGDPYVFMSHYAGDQSACGSCRNKAGGIDGQTIACPICNQPYKFYSHYVGDQSVCGDCRMKAHGGKYPTYTDTGG